MMRFSVLRVATLFLVCVFSMAMWPGIAWLGSPPLVAAQSTQSDAPLGDDHNSADDDAPFGDHQSVDHAELSDSDAASAKKRRQVSPAEAREVNAQTGRAKSASISVDTIANDKIHASLSMPCEFNFEETPYTELAEELENVYGINIVLTASARDDALTEDEAFTSTLNGISLASGLRTILEEKNATFCVQGGMLKIISLDEAGDLKYLARRMIDVSETLELIRGVERDRIGKPKPGSPITEQRLQSRGGGGGGGVFAIQTTETDSGDSPVEAAEITKLANAITKAVRQSQPDVQLVPTLVTAESILLDAIKENTSVDGWCNTNYSIGIVGGILIVNATEEVNETVESLATDLKFHIIAAAEKKR